MEVKIESTEAQIQELRLSMTGLSKLVRIYADLISDVKIATASSDKFSELIELQPDILNYYKSFFVHKMRDEYTRVASGIPKLPKSKNIESAEKFGNLEIIARNLRDLINKLIDNDYLNNGEVNTPDSFSRSKRR